MTNYQTTEVYNYLSYLEHYLNGDLASFHKVCAEAERVENIPAPVITASSSGQSRPMNQQASSVSNQGSMYPGGIASRYLSLASNSQEVFRLTIPVSLTLFATVDCVGYLSGANVDHTKTNENFKEFFKQSSIPVTEADSVFINQVFRQGLTHVYFPKLGLGISYHSNNPSGKLFFRDNYGNLILNANRLEEIVINTFKSIKQDASLYPRMETRYQSLKSDYQTRYGNTIVNYPA